MKVVASYSGRSWRRGGIEPDAYLDLHAKLLAGCRALAAAGGAEREFYDALAELARPWVSLAVLARTDREILSHLWERCREADRRLHGHRPRTGPTWSAKPLLLVMAGMAALFGIGYALDERTSLFGGRVRGLVLGAWSAVCALSEGERIVLLGIIVGTLAAGLFAYARRH